MNLFLLLFVMAGVAVQLSRAAERLDMKQVLQRTLHARHGVAGPVTSYRFKRHAARLPRSELEEVVSLGHGSKLVPKQIQTSVQGTKLIKMQQYYEDRVVPDGIVTLETDAEEKHVLDMNGYAFKDIDLDLEQGSDLEPDEALALCVRYNEDESLKDDIQYIKVEKDVLFDADVRAYPAYMAEYLVAPAQGQMRRPSCFIDARDSRVVFSWNALSTRSVCSASGTGGNRKIGKIRYGQFPQCLNLKRENGSCYLENKYVKVIDNNFSKRLSDPSEPAASYNCDEIDDEINGAYSPLLDALFYGTAVGRMFEDWYGTSPLKDTIVLRVHYSVNESIAFWKNGECIFGDGDGVKNFPYVSMDVVAHEIGHGVTEQNSDLLYSFQSGAVNEAFSDMTGETAEAYLDTPDWVVGNDLTVGRNPFRYLDDPQKDGKSISHAYDYTDSMNVHFTSGVYNRAFYLLVQEQGLPIKEAYHVFLLANQVYWHHFPTYNQAACDVMKAAYDRGLDGNKFRRAFSAVGVETCDLKDHVVGLRNGEVYSNIEVSRTISPTFFFALLGRGLEKSITVNATSQEGDVSIILSNKIWGEEGEGKNYAEGNGTVYFQLPVNPPQHITISLTTTSEKVLKDVTLVAVITCRDVNPDHYAGIDHFCL